MARSRIVLLLPILFLISSSSVSSSGHHHHISAAPAYLPDIAPTEYVPLFPSPGGSEFSPAGSAVPLIPSSPSPPNPDSGFGPDTAAIASPVSSAGRRWRDGGAARAVVLLLLLAVAVCLFP
ncbi:hypothetical protein M569_01024 [Genlisea aurea]|uniref:Uncharacterized protein n=1 Tax=Genlisea aurea TaxID=192259 RepID=S8D8F5_9LAMI|nr:hypothetical protein M569_01024 [Genlisea aurea]